MIRRVTSETLLSFGIDEPAKELKCTQCDQVNPVSEWREKLQHVLFEFKHFDLICPNCMHEHDPFNGDVPRYYV